MAASNPVGAWAPPPGWVKSAQADGGHPDGSRSPRVLDWSRTRRGRTAKTTPRRAQATRRALAAGIAAKVVSERLGHATIAITMDTYSHVLPGLDERAAATVAQLILEGDESANASVDKALTNGTWSPLEPEVTKGGEARSARSDAVAEADGNRTR